MVSSNAKSLRCTCHAKGFKDGDRGGQGRNREVLAGDHVSELHGIPVEDRLAEPCVVILFVAGVLQPEVAGLAVPLLWGEPGSTREANLLRDLKFFRRDNLRNQRFSAKLRAVCTWDGVAQPQRGSLGSGSSSRN